uniref:Secreted protein n=1 Tax=Heterorhabditis bacteriophora TaxID=37862 RepID=A0A1I7WB62_HETBA
MVCNRSCIHCLRRTTWHCGVRAKQSGRLLAFIAAVSTSNIQMQICHDYNVLMFLEVKNFKYIVNNFFRTRDPDLFHTII